MGIENAYVHKSLPGEDYNCIPQFLTVYSAALQ